VRNSFAKVYDVILVRFGFALYRMEVNMVNFRRPRFWSFNGETRFAFMVGPADQRFWKRIESSVLDALSLHAAPFGSESSRSSYNIVFCVNLITSQLFWNEFVLEY
jgi:hypothetical protein